MQFKIGNNVAMSYPGQRHQHTYILYNLCMPVPLSTSKILFCDLISKFLTHIQSKKHQWFNETYSHASTWEGKKLWKIQTVMSKCCVSTYMWLDYASSFYYPSTSTWKHLSQLSWPIIYCKIFLSIKMQYYKDFQPFRALCCKLQKWNYIMHCTDNGGY